MDEPAAVYFLHIPKTGGCTLTHLLRDRFAPEAVAPYCLARDLVDVPPEQMRGYRLFCGHFGYNLPALVGRPMIVLTLLREPVQRVVSLFGHIRRVATHPLHEQVRRENMTLTDFVHDPHGAAYARNHQVYHLAYLDAAHPADSWRSASPAERARGKLEEDAAFRAVPGDELVERAGRRLDRMAFVGLTERMDESVRLLGRTFGWDDLPPPPRLNATPAGPEDVPASTLNRIRELTELDARVHAHARRLFEDRVRRLRQEAAAESLTKCD
jgi:hypothetical protein